MFSKKNEWLIVVVDLGSNSSGYYTLQAVLTHRGRSSSSGHYVGWVRHEGDTWIKCDDDTVTPVTSEDILKLSGGGIDLINYIGFVVFDFCGLGDWHCAYVLLYGPRLLELPEDGESGGEPMAIESGAAVNKS